MPPPSLLGLPSGLHRLHQALEVTFSRFSFMDCLSFQRHGSRDHDASVRLHVGGLFVDDPGDPAKPPPNRVISEASSSERIQFLTATD